MQIVVDGEFKTKAIEIISNAEKEILVSSFKVQYEEKKGLEWVRKIWDGILEKARQGKRILVLLNKEVAKKI